MEDGVVGFKDPIREVGLAQDLPDFLHAVQLRRTWRQAHQRDVVGDVAPDGWCASRPDP